MEEQPVTVVVNPPEGEEAQSQEEPKQHKKLWGCIISAIIGVAIVLVWTHCARRGVWVERPIDVDALNGHGNPFRVELAMERYNTVTFVVDAFHNGTYTNYAEGRVVGAPVKTQVYACLSKEDLATLDIGHTYTICGDLSVYTHEDDDSVSIWVGSTDEFPMLMFHARFSNVQ